MKTIAKYRENEDER